MKKLYATTGGMFGGFDLGSATQPLTEMDTNPLFEGDRTVLRDDGNNKTRTLSASRAMSKSRQRTRSASPTKRELPTTLQIQSLTQDNLKNTLLESIVSLLFVVIFS